MEKYNKERPIDFKERQKISVEILEHVDRFCRKNDIQYSLAYGTLLGAVRHKGFIPWDDDVDIIMTRTNYDKFISLYYNSSDRYILGCYQTDKIWHQGFAEVYDNKTFLDTGRNTLGVYIDVFPIEGVPDRGWGDYRSIFIKKRETVLRKRLSYKRVKDPVYQYFRYLGKQILFPRSRKFYINDFNKFYLSHTVENSNYGSNLNSPIFKETEIMPSSFFKEFIELEYEGKKYMAIKKYDEYLTRIYGNYMEFPPKEKRVPPHQFPVFWKD